MGEVERPVKSCRCARPLQQSVASGTSYRRKNCRWTGAALSDMGSASDAPTRRPRWTTAGRWRTQPCRRRREGPGREGNRRPRRRQSPV